MGIAETVQEAMAMTLQFATSICQAEAGSCAVSIEWAGDDPNRERLGRYARAGGAIL
ncbi:hypothetical protein [Methylocystis sp. H62]|uniref:hypothetical protein n=1 Tax=Methylocystis sp. H62 TaxID=2785789 RepID=UPI001FEF5A35|nr:hypothetical protein [Methylocystis sp. H62]